MTVVVQQHSCDVNAEVHPDGGVIQCKNPACVTKWVHLIDFFCSFGTNYQKYHLSCVGLEISQRGWMCEACISDGTGWAGKRTRRT